MDVTNFIHGISGFRVSFVVSDVDAALLGAIKHFDSKAIHVLDRFREILASWCESSQESDFGEFAKLANRLEKQFDLVEAGFRLPVRLDLARAIKSTIPGIDSQYGGRPDPETFRFKIPQRERLREYPHEFAQQ